MTEIRTGGSDSFTVQHVLNILDDHIAAIEDINTNEGNSPLISVPQTQENINRDMQIYIDGIKAMLAWDGLDGEGDPLPANTEPDMVSWKNDGGNDSTYQAAITLGEAYITENT